MYLGAQLVTLKINAGAIVFVNHKKLFVNHKKLWKPVTMENYNHQRNLTEIIVTKRCTAKNLYLQTEIEHFGTAFN